MYIRWEDFNAGAAADPTAHSNGAVREGWKSVDTSGYPPNIYPRAGGVPPNVMGADPTAKKKDKAAAFAAAVGGRVGGMVASPVQLVPRGGGLALDTRGASPTQMR